VISGARFNVARSFDKFGSILSRGDHFAAIGRAIAGAKCNADKSARDKCVSRFAFSLVNRIVVLFMGAPAISINGWRIPHTRLALPSPPFPPSLFLFPVSDVFVAAESPRLPFNNDPLLGGNLRCRLKSALLSY